jgi:hypothetical protein
VLGLALRLPSFDDALYGDELATYFVVTDHGLDEVVDLLQGTSPTGDLSPPLFFMLAWLTEGLGDPQQSLRVVSLLAGAAAIPLTYLLGLRTLSRPAALTGAALMALSPYLVYYTTEARAYGLTVLLVLLSTLALLRALDSGRFWWWAAYAACSCAAVYAHYTPVFLLAAQLAWAFFARPDARVPLLASNAAAAIAYLPWLPTLLDNADSPGSKVIGILSPLNLSSVRIELGRWGLGHPYIPLRELPGWGGIAMLLGGLAAGAAGIVASWRRASGGWHVPRPSSGTVLVVVLAAATPVGVLLYSLVGDTLWTSRNLISSWPGLALTLGAVATAGAGWLRIAAVALVVGAFGIGAIRMLDADSQRPDYEEAARFIVDDGQAGDPVVEIPFPTPGPLTPVEDVALPHVDREAARRRPALRLGYPSKRAQLRSPPYSLLPTAPGETVARRAARLAGDGRLYLVAPGTAELRMGLTEPFVGALGPGVRHLETREFPGLVPVSVAVYGEE